MVDKVVLVLAVDGFTKTSFSWNCYDNELRLKEVELQAIWLSENQSKSLIQARVYFDASVNRLFCEIDHFVESSFSAN